MDIGSRSSLISCRNNVRCMLCYDFGHVLLSGKFGSRRPLYFPFTAEYWCGGCTGRKAPKMKNHEPKGKRCFSPVSFKFGGNFNLCFKPVTEVSVTLLSQAFECVTLHLGRFLADS